MTGPDLTTITQDVIDANSRIPDPRTRQVLGALVRHLHDFTREVELTTEEWEYALDFLLRAGEISTAGRNEFSLLSDVLGLSALVDLLRDRNGAGAWTHASQLGPFYVPDAPLLPFGADLKGDLPGDPVVLDGRVLSTDGEPIAGAEIELWHTQADGLYDVQVDGLDAHRFRCRMITDDAGAYRIRTILPVGYVAPTDGPVGDLLASAQRNIWRPAHYHFRIRAPGFRILVTELFPEGDEHLDGDVAFGVRDSLVVEPIPAEEPGADNLIRYDFKLVRQAD